MVELVNRFGLQVDCERDGARLPLRWGTFESTLRNLIRLGIYCCCLMPMGAYSGNLAPFMAWASSHPTCGINPSFPERPPGTAGPPNSYLPTISPWAYCKTLAAGYGANPGKTESERVLVSFLVTIGTKGGFEKIFGPLNNFELKLECRPPPDPLSLPSDFPPPPRDVVSTQPICTRSNIEAFLERYNAMPSVQGYKRFVAALEVMNLNDPKSLEKLRQAEAVFVASGGNMTIEELADLLR